MFHVDKLNDRGGSGSGVDSSGSGSSSEYYHDGMYAGMISNGGSATSSVFGSHDSGGYGGNGNGNGNGGHGNGNGGYGGGYNSGNNVINSKLDPRINRERVVVTS